MTELVPWIEEYSLHYSPIDEQHKQLLALLNRIHEADMTGSGGSSSEMLFALVVFTETHFAYEERLLDLVGFPSLKKHSLYHEVMKHRTREIVQNYSKRRAFDKDEVLKFLSNWWTSHILTEDKQYEPYLVDNGLTNNDLG